MSLANRRCPFGARPYGRAIPLSESTAYLEVNPKRIPAALAGVIVADSQDAHLLHQPGVPAAWWFPV